MLKKTITSVLYIISFTSVIIASGIKDANNWWNTARPYFIVWFVATVLAVCFSHFDQIRRVTYPALVCVSAWAYNHKIIKTKFTRNTHRVYKMNHSSYKNLFNYTQDIFDIYLEALHS